MAADQARQEQQLTNILVVGGNAVSAFMSWRLSATNACDVTLVWKNGFENVSQYGLSFKSATFGNERFKPRQVVRTPEEAAKTSRAPYDYVLLCVKALPDVYDIASIIESVVAPQHTCILINTTHSLGVESYLEQRFPTNVVLSLVAGAELSQLGPSEFEHKGTAEIWVGPANKNPSIPASIQSDMAEALAMTLSSGQVDCKVSTNIRQQQYERMIGPIAFHPASVLFETSNHAELLEKTGARAMISGIIDEILLLAKSQGCDFPEDFREQTMEAMIQPTATPSTMYQDFTARRPLEIETFLGAPIKLAQDVGVPVPRIETLYALLHNANTLNQSRPPPSAAVAPQPTPAQTPRMGPGPMGPGPNQRGPMNGPMPGHPGRPGMMRPGSRAPSMTGGPPPQMRRGPSMNNGFGPQMRMNGNGHRGPPQQQTRRPSLEGNELEEFSHLMLYDNLPEGALPEGAIPEGAGPGGEMGLRERELALRQRELSLREQEFHMRRRMPPPPASHAGGYDEDDEDGEDFFDPMAAGRNVPVIDPDNFDMMSVTSKRTRKAPSANQLRNNPEMGGPQMRGGGGGGRGMFGRPKVQNRTSARLMSEIPGLHENLMGNPLLGYSSDRYGGVDRHNLGQESRTNSLTAERLNELSRGGPPGQGPYPGPMPPQMGRRASNSPGHPLGPPMGPPRGPPGQQRPYPPNGQNGYPPHMNGRPSPPGVMGSPMQQRPPTQQGQVPQHVEQQNGVSHLYPPKSGPQERSLTGSASASAGSGDSNHSVPLDSDPSAHSSSSSLGPRPPHGFR
ncbi:hypothetical protein D6C90_08970 [Aureobasidium pullulans]|uniref:ApbA-domain-containing protein n=1 Tax=Aureobasidium pullulans TaxID=5580 RepID=A0A4S9TT26_AURPU|nr:hypothetical protein D6C91_09458 [Aureobasidium pullulans]THZ27768.1 hypothetical protein D6C90_08970 [Aureobasidium pullulans]